MLGSDLLSFQERRISKTEPGSASLLPRQMTIVSHFDWDALPHDKITAANRRMARGLPSTRTYFHRESAVREKRLP